jgi:transposase-like protein
MNEDNNIPILEPRVNLEDIAKHLSVSTDTIRGWINKATIPYSRAAI